MSNNIDGAPKTIKETQREAAKVSRDERKARNAEMIREHAAARAIREEHHRLTVAKHRANQEHNRQRSGALVSALAAESPELINQTFEFMLRLHRYSGIPYADVMRSLIVFASESGGEDAVRERLRIITSRLPPSSTGRNFVYATAEDLRHSGFLQMCDNWPQIEDAATSWARLTACMVALTADRAEHYREIDEAIRSKGGAK